MNIPNDPFVRELLPEFVDSWIDDINNQFDELVNKKNTDDLYRMAHTLKGSCFQFGLDEIANMGIELMDKAKAMDWIRVGELKADILKQFQSVKEYLTLMSN